ncbi:MAG: hypothetical protein QXT64_05350 [Desulfurococcaceae archaeon]
MKPKMMPFFVLMLISLVSVSSELVFSAVSVTIPLTYNISEHDISPKQFVTAQPTYGVGEFLASRTSPVSLTASLAYDINEMLQDMNATEGTVTVTKTITETITETVTRPGKTYTTTYVTTYTKTITKTTEAWIGEFVSSYRSLVSGVLVGVGLLILLLVLLLSLWGRRYG